MRKLLIYSFVLAFASLFICGSCEEDAEKQAERIEKSKKYFTEYKVYSNVDSASTGVRVFVGEVGGRKLMYHLYSGKFKSQMEVWDITEPKKEKKDTVIKK